MKTIKEVNKKFYDAFSKDLEASKDAFNNHVVKGYLLIVEYEDIDTTTKYSMGLFGDVFSLFANIQDGVALWIYGKQERKNSTLQ